MYSLIMSLHLKPCSSNWKILWQIRIFGNIIRFLRTILLSLFFCLLKYISRNFSSKRSHLLAFCSSYPLQSPFSFLTLGICAFFPFQYHHGFISIIVLFQVSPFRIFFNIFSWKIISVSVCLETSLSYHHSWRLYSKILS